MTSSCLLLWKTHLFTNVRWQKLASSFFCSSLKWLYKYFESSVYIFNTINIKWNCEQKVVVVITFYFFFCEGAQKCFCCFSLWLKLKTCVFVRVSLQKKHLNKIGCLWWNKQWHPWFSFCHPWISTLLDPFLFFMALQKIIVIWHPWISPLLFIKHLLINLLVVPLAGPLEQPYPCAEPPLLAVGDPCGAVVVERGVGVGVEALQLATEVGQVRGDGGWKGTKTWLWACMHQQREGVWWLSLNNPPPPLPLRSKNFKPPSPTLAASHLRRPKMFQWWTRSWACQRLVLISMYYTGHRLVPAYPGRGIMFAIVFKECFQVFVL